MPRDLPRPEDLGPVITPLDLERIRYYDKYEYRISEDIRGTIYGVDSLNSGDGKTVSAAASVPAVLNGTVNGRKTNVKLGAGEVSVIPLTGSSAEVTNGKFNAVLGTKHNYPPQFIRGIRLPAPKAVSKTRRFDDFFMFSFNDVSLTWKESTGVTGWSRQIISNAENTMRETAANGFNLFMVGRVIQPDILPKAALT